MRSDRRVLVVLSAVLVIALASGTAGCSSLLSRDTAAEKGQGSLIGRTMEGAAPGAGEAALAPEQDAVQSAPAAGETVPPDAERMVVRNKAVRIRVEKVTESIPKVQALTKEAGGHVSRLQVASETAPVYRYDESGAVTGDGTPLAAYVTVRIPVAKFEDFVSKTSKLGRVIWESETTDDVTQQHVDMAARLKNLRAEEERLRDVLGRARTVKDILLVEKELSRVRGEIESLDAQVKSLEREAAMATVTIEMVEPQPVVRPEGEDWGFVDAIRQGVRGFMGVLAGIVFLIIATAPLWIIGIALFFLIRWRIRKRRAARARLAADTDASTIG